MYIFKIGYPLLVILSFVSLGIIRIQEIKPILSKIWKIWILSIPIIALILRVLRRNMDIALGYHFVIFTILYIAILPIFYFTYIYVLARNECTTTTMSSKHTRYLLIVLIVLINESIMVILDSIMNLTFINSLDILILPWVRIAIAQFMIFIFINLNIYLKRFNIGMQRFIIWNNVYYYTMAFGLAMGAIILFSLGAVWTVNIYIQETSPKGIIMLLILIGIGWLFSLYLGFTRKLYIKDEDI